MQRTFSSNVKVAGPWKKWCLICPRRRPIYNAQWRSPRGRQRRPCPLPRENQEFLRGSGAQRCRNPSSSASRDSIAFEPKGVPRSGPTPKARPAQRTPRLHRRACCAKAKPERKPSPVKRGAGQNGRCHPRAPKATTRVIGKRMTVPIARGTEHAEPGRNAPEEWACDRFSLC